MGYHASACCRVAVLALDFLDDAGEFAIMLIVGLGMSGDMHN
jgi:hypothetical protein